MLVPTGAILPFIGTEVPEGFILWQEYKIYESQLPKLYARYSTVENFTKGSDSSGNYVQLPSINDRTLQACSSFSLVGKLLEAALPNISGLFNTYAFSDVKTAGLLNANCYGVFSKSVITDPGSIDGAGSIEKRYVETNINFNAASGNVIYEGSTVQPPACQVLMIIRT